MTEGFSYRYRNGKSITMIVKGLLHHFYHLEHCSLKPVNGYNAAKQYGHFYNEDNFTLGHSSAMKASILQVREMMQKLNNAAIALYYCICSI